MGNLGSGENLTVQTAADRLPSGLTNIEQINRDALTCQNPRVPVILGFCEELRLAVLWRPRCKLWSCPVCAQINTAMWAFIAASGVDYFMALGQTPSFWTITSHERLTAARTFQVFPSAWAKLSTRMRRAYPGMEYFCVPEPHADGRLHMHGLASVEIEERWLKDNARACGLGYQVDAQPVQKASAVSHYVTKYLLKQLGENRLPRNFRRVRTSRGWPRPESAPADFRWRWVVLTTRDSEEIEAEALRRDGYRVILGDHRTTWAQVEAYRPLAALNIGIQNLDKLRDSVYAEASVRESGRQA
jgi:hypothetical protein